MNVILRLICTSIYFIAPQNPTYRYMYMNTKMLSTGTLVYCVYLLIGDLVVYVLKI